MIAILASLISAGWLVLLFAPFHNDPDGEERLVWLVGLDIVLFLTGLVALVLAARGRYSWRIAGLIAVTPLLHWLGSALDVLGGVVVVAPSILVLAFAGVRHLRQRKPHEGGAA